MSTIIGSGSLEPIKDTDALAAWLATGEKSQDRWAVGTEYEKLGVVRATGRPLQYDAGPGVPSIRWLLDGLAEASGWKPIVDDGALIGLQGGMASIALEPGGQLEFSGSPFRTIDEAAAEMKVYETWLRQVDPGHQVEFMWTGHQPVHGFEDLDFMPKRRYGIMRRYLPTKGDLALFMMQRTCTVQANFDFGDEVDMGRKFRVAQGLASLVTALFANSPLRDGAPSGYRSFRAHIWTRTDPDRCGLQRWAFDGDLPTYERYTRWALDVPLFFIERGGRYLDCAGLPFSELLRRGFDGHHATLDDWQLHLSTLFPVARLKTYLEVRSADCVGPQWLLALPALWKGILYDDTCLDAAWDLVRGWSFDQRLQHRADVTRMALEAPTPHRYGTADVALELVRIARHGLERIARRWDHGDETPWLDALEERIATRHSLACLTLDWLSKAPRTPADIVAHYTAEWPDLPTG